LFKKIIKYFVLILSAFVVVELVSMLSDAIFSPPVHEDRKSGIGVGVLFLYVIILFIPILAPTSTWFRFASVFLYIILISMIVSHCSSISEINHRGSVGDGIGIVFLLSLNIPLLLGIVIRIIISSILSKSDNLKEYGWVKKYNK